MKRLIASFLSITLLLSQFTMPVSAATVINDVGVSVVAPSAAKYPNYASTLDDDSYIMDDETSEYKEGGITWYNGNTMMLPDEAFEIGGVYTVKVELLRVSEDYAFSVNPPISATINGNDAYISYVNTNYAIIEYTFPPIVGYTATFSAGEGTGTMDPIENVAGKFTLPECTFTAPVAKRFKGWSVGGTTGEFYPGEEAPIYSNITVTALWETDYGKQQIYDVVATSEDIDSLPVLYGKMNTPKFTIIEGAPAYVNATTGNIRWMKKVGDDWEIQYDGRFTPGEWRVFTSVRIDSGADKYELGNPTTLTVNGQQWTPDNGTGKPSVHDDYSVIFFMSPVYVIEDDPDIVPPVPLESVNLRIEGYQDGLPVADAYVVSDDNVYIDNYTILEIKDENNDGNPEDLKEATGNFTVDKTYAVKITLFAESGYDLTYLEKENVSLENSRLDAMEVYDENNDCYRCAYILVAPTIHEHSMLRIVSPATTKGEGKIQHFCEFCSLFYVETVAKIKDVKISETSYTYDGKTKTPTVTVVDDNNKKLVEGEDYTVKYPSGRKSIGQYTVKITFKNKYSGEVSKTFTIVPKGTKIKTLTKGKKKITVKWKKQTKQTKGYQIQYSTSKKFKGAKIKTIKKNKTTKVVLKKLKAKKTYYVRIRTYKTVGKTKYYSAWSKAKRVKVK